LCSTDAQRILCINAASAAALLLLLLLLLHGDNDVKWRRWSLRKKVSSPHSSSHSSPIDDGQTCVPLIFLADDDAARHRHHVEIVERFGLVLPLR
jgi:hypothetical protein